MAKKQTQKAQATADVVEATVTESVPVSDSVAETTTTVEPVQLTIADLQLLARIVDLASRRGAFQAGELSQVGDAYNKLSGFLSYVESVQKKEATEAGETTEAAPAA